MPRTTLLLVRHGARYDFANKQAWRARCAALGLEGSDPPLSALGHVQAAETAAFIAREERVTTILVSPYLRVIQTARPLAHATELPICVENALAEFHHVPQKIPPAGKRVGVFPEIDERYEPMLRECTTDEAGNEPHVEYMRRLLLFGRELGTRHAGETVACFSHAASVALVGALTGCDTLVEAGCFAPCGVYKLVSDDAGATWSLLRSGGDNTAHVTTNDPSTFPWGFKHTSSATLLACEEAFSSALALGPTADLDPSHAARPSRGGPSAAREVVDDRAGLGEVAGPHAPTAAATTSDAARWQISATLVLFGVALGLAMSAARSRAKY